MLFEKLCYASRLSPLCHCRLGCLCGWCPPRPNKKPRHFRGQLHRHRRHRCVRRLSSSNDLIHPTGDQGTAWPVYAAGYSKTALHPFARSGATCSNNITFRPFPPVFENQLPLYFTETGNGTLNLPADETIYTLWIGTNDLGVDSLITGSNNASIVDVSGCMVNWVRTLYASGARNFIMQNVRLSVSFFLWIAG